MSFFSKYDKVSTSFRLSWTETLVCVATCLFSASLADLVKHPFLITILTLEIHF